MAGEGIWGPILHPRDVYHRESVSEGLLLQVSQTGVADIKRAVTKDLQKGAMVDGNGEVMTAQDKVTCLVKGISYGQCFPLDRGVAGLCRVSESTADQGDPPSLPATEQVSGRALAVLLE